MNDVVQRRARRVIVGVAVLLASAAAVVGSAQLAVAAQPGPVTTVSAAGGDPGDPVGTCWYTRACSE